jgi:penicillin-binding protein 1A
VLSLAIAALLPAALDIPQLPEIKRTPQITYVDRAGVVLGVRGGQAAPPVDMARLPPYVPAAFVSIEDKRFYEHGAIDPIGIARAVVTDLAKGRAAEGASTITQQLVRNLFLTQDRTVERKTQELLLSVQMEQKYSKKQILSLYLSRVYFGSGAYGIEAASQRFFNKPASRLSVREAAALAALMKSPTNYSPVDHPDASDERTRLVLDAMVETNSITKAQRARALAKPLKVYQADPTQGAQYFVDWVDQQTRKVIPQPRQDLIVQTTLDAGMEAAAAAATREEITRDREAQGLQTALVAIDGQGAVRAMIGGDDYGQSQYNRAVLARRQAGSSWKPFVYLTAMESGLTPDTQAIDQPVTIAGWSPRNHNDSFLGPITLEKAMAQSVNTVAAQVADQVGRDKVAATARRLGISSPINTDPAMALGTSQVTPIEMASAYAAFANGGQRADAYAILKITTNGGQVVWRRPPDRPAQVIGNPSLGEMDRMLRAVVAEGTGAHAAIRGYDIAGKTGTTSDSKDGWFCGFTGGFSACAWMGRDDAQPVAGLAGGGPPAQVWRRFMLAALPRAGVTAIPAGPPAPLTPLAPTTVALAPPPASGTPQPATPAPTTLDGQLNGLFADGSPPQSGAAAPPPF